ncbi:hypothetical protein [Pectinatus haikarae]|uniref:Uncharacterized protein n=1 Tax=Pectinatus haikarae TaxID=349096 RepID=A0ABT9Y8H1_9FIRM|nr:hypothetical protein [Pectinatus haikarae]MDQ0204123.1 hypothetical protein [Pectinatus haikarae]
MLNSMMNYPYPVLRNKPADYKTCTFSAEIKKTDKTNGYSLDIVYKTDNNQIKELLDKRKITYALQIQCISTWYRKLEISETSKQTLFLSSDMIHERVDMCPCIIALEDIADFKNDDFSEDFNGISFKLNKGEVAAIGERQKFDAVYESDIIKKGDPIVHFINDTNSSVMYCEWEYNTIQIHLPQSQYKQYTKIGWYESWKVPMLNAVYVVPAIVQGISMIYQDEFNNGDRNLESYLWYKTLKVLIQKTAKDDDREYKKMLNDPIRTAQLLLNDNSSQALELIAKSARL